MDRRTFLTSVGTGCIAGGVLAENLASEQIAAEQKGTAKSFRVIDTHLHVFNTSLEGKNDVPKYISTPATVEDALAAMDLGRVAKAFLISYGAADVGVQIRARGFRPEALRKVLNKDYQYRAFKAHADRFWWFTDHVDPLRPGYLDDLQRDFEAGAAGVKLLPWFHGVLPDHPGLIGVYELCSKLHKPVILDLSWWYFHLNPLYAESESRRGLVKSMADYARLLTPVFRQFADVPISLAHAGTAKTPSDYEEIFPLIAAHPNVSCDLAAATDYSEALVQQLVSAVGAQKVMYGTDWPYWATSGPNCYRQDARRWEMIADGCPELSVAEKQRILADNAEAFATGKLPDGRQSHASALHRQAAIIVIHDHMPLDTDMPLLMKGGVTAKIYNIGVDVEIGRNYLESGKLREGWKQKSLVALEAVRRVIDANAQHLQLALSADDIVRAKASAKVAILLGVEGGKLLEGNIDNLKFFYDKGLRELQLRWAVPNQIVEQEALTPFGSQVVRQCQQLGILVDTTHIPQRAFEQVAEMSQRPIIVSHGTSQELGETRVKAISRLKGVVGIHFYSSYLRDRPCTNQVIRAVDDLVQMGGIDIVGLGIDFFPTDGKWAEFQNAQGTRNIAWAIPDVGYLHEVTDALVSRNYPDEQILAILGGNMLRVLRETI